MTSTNDPDARRYFDAAQQSLTKGELADSYNTLSVSANSPELLATRQKSEDLKAQQQDVAKVLSGAMDASDSVYSAVAAAEAIVSETGDSKKNGKKKDDLTYVLTLQSINARIADLDAGHRAFQNIFDQYSDDDIRAGKHLNEDGKFKDPKAEEYWLKYCERHGLDPNDQDLRKDPTILHNVQDWIQEKRLDCIAERDAALGNDAEAKHTDIVTKTDSEKNSEASFEIAKNKNDAQGLKTEEQEAEEFEKIRPECMKSFMSEADIHKAERAYFESASDDAQALIKVSNPEKTYLFEEKNPEEPSRNMEVEQSDTVASQSFTP